MVRGVKGKDKIKQKCLSECVFDIQGGGANVGGRSSGASIAADSKKKGGKPAKGQGKPATQETETSDSPEFINPLLEGGDLIDGQLWVAGNRVLINLNLTRNPIGESGLEALLKAMQYQATLTLDSHGGTGLMRLLVGRSRRSEHSFSRMTLQREHDVMQKINDLMTPKDPFYKPPPQTPDVES
ncbi:leucine-rich repeat-containing protein 71-like isoform X2 [Mya arenaria]|uniref:leucine-rich repeat-containing protein 71-like isoform X2 n=1 Tax=Mya arenaria TaxID=6604 RepID=UPI0022E3B172|nr:leucine-rich repeat-containing protein 71-like isoform X2 [Mya arenaria]